MKIFLSFFWSIHSFKGFNAYYWPKEGCPRIWSSQILIFFPFLGLHEIGSLMIERDAMHKDQIGELDTCLIFFSRLIIRFEVRYFFKGADFQQAFFPKISIHKILAPRALFINCEYFTSKMPHYLCCTILIHFTKFNFLVFDFPSCHRNFFNITFICWIIPEGAKRVELW